MDNPGPRPDLGWIATLVILIAIGLPWWAIAPPALWVAAPYLMWRLETERAIRRARSALKPR